MSQPIAAVQMVSMRGIGPNIVAAQLMIRQAAARGAKVVVLPENFACFPQKGKDLLMVQEAPGSGRIQDYLAKCAEVFGVWVVAGSIPLATEDQDKVTSSCMVFNQHGKLVARYDKIHLLNANLPETAEEYRESDYLQAGASSAVVVDTPVGRLGLSIGHDLRFPELYRKLRERGADILVVCASFVHTMGRAHWQTLLQARAIETQCYVVAANQGGVHENGQTTYGHSMIIDPWGAILEQRASGLGVVSAPINLIALQVMREEFPVWAHQRPIDQR